MQKTLEDRARSLCCSWCRAGSPCRTGERPRIERILQELVRECAAVAIEQSEDKADFCRVHLEPGNHVAQGLAVIWVRRVYGAILNHFGLEPDDGI